MIEALPNANVLIKIADGEVTGVSGCNSFRGEYESDGMSLVVASLGSTLVSCGEEINAQENNVLEALAAATHISHDEDVLLIHYGDIAFLVLKRYPFFEGASWVLDTIVSDGDVVEPLPDTTIAMNFADGQVTGVDRMQQLCGTLHN